MQYFILSFILLLVLSSSIFSTEDKKLTLTYLYSVLSDHHELVESFNDDIELARQKALFADSKPNPRFEMGYWLEPIQTKNGSTRSKLAVSQKILPKSRLQLRKRLEFGQVSIAELQREKVIQDLKYEVTKLFFDYLFLYEKLDILSNNFRIIESWNKLLETHYSHHDFRYPQLIQLQMEATRIQDQIREIKESIPNTFQQLKSIALIEVSEPLRPIFTAAIKKRTLVEDIDNNVDLLIMKSQLERQKIRKNLEETFQIPDKMIKTEWTTLQNENSLGTKNPWMVGIGFDLILNKKQLNANVEAENRRTHSLEKRLGYFRKDLKSKIKNSIFNLENQLKKFLLFSNDLLPRTQELLKSLQINYSARTNDMDFFALLETLRSLLKIELDITTVKKSYFHEMAYYQRLNGGLIF